MNGCWQPQTEGILGNYNWREDQYFSLKSPSTGLSGRIYSSIVYAFKEAEQAAKVFDGAPGFAYPRIGCKTPTVDKLEEELLKLELGNVDWLADYQAITYASGMCAITNLMLNLADNGRQIISSPYVYGGTYYLFTEVFPRLGIKCLMIDDPTNLRDWEAALNSVSGQACLFAEDNANPVIKKLDNKAIAWIAHRHGAFYVCDMTITTPVLERPLTCVNSWERPDAVVHSLSKNINGYSNALGGAVIAGRGLINDTENFFGLNNYFAVIGGVMDSRVADTILHNMASLERRVKAKVSNAKVVANFLRSHPKVTRVYGPGCDLLSFEIKGGLEEARRVINSYELIVLAPHLGDIRSISIHPASTTHNKVPKQEREKMGVTDSLIRLSVGMEDVRDIISDLETALARI